MAKLQLTFKDVTGTLDKNGAEQSKVKISMTTGSEHSECYCYFNVKWKKVTITQSGKSRTRTEEKGSGVLSFAFNLQNARFKKEMYSPNEISVDVQIAAGYEANSQKDPNATYYASIPRDTLESSFLNKKVSLSCDDQVVCDDYFVQEIMPSYKKDAMYVTFKIYSPDYLLTKENYCRTFVSKKLGAEILTDEIKNYKLPYDSSKTIAIDFSNMKHIKLAKDNSDGHKAGTEHLFAYLVQYNESFYDFLKRTTNRWGEFMYYEDKKFQLGYGYAASNNTDYKEVASSTTYCDLTSQQKQENAGKYNNEAPIDEQIQSNVLKKGKYDTVKTRVNSLLDYKNLDGDIYVVKKLAALLNNDKTIYQFLVDTGVDDALDLLKANELSQEKNDKFDDWYFNNKDKSDTKYNDNQFKDDEEFNQFSEHTPFLNTKAYVDIVEKEFSSGRNAIMMDFDTTYPSIKLGQVITYDSKTYLVVKVEGYQPHKLVIVNNEFVEHKVDQEKVCYKVTAVPLCRVYKEEEQDVEVTDPETGEKKTEKKKVKVYDNTYYPSVIPEGHIRRSGPQLAVVSEGTADDPLRKNRVRIKYDWQGDKEWSSPWLLYSPGGASSKSGVYTWHQKGQKVIVDYVAGNIERPYVMGSVETGMPAQMKTYQQVLQTPWEQKILMTDGAGAGATAMLASFNPGLKMLQGFWPTAQLPGLDFEKSENLEGNIEITDKYGFYSIKGCTNDRNITIKSPWGDVKINAFSGITLSAPNGDVTIKGKNVKIEAGGNLTLTSGKNIKQKFLMDGEDLNPISIASTITKTVTSKAASLLIGVTDLSLLRHIVEVFIKPVEGKLQITAGRYLMLEAGGKKTGYPIEAYKQKKMKDHKDEKDTDRICVEAFERLKYGVYSNYDRLNTIYNAAQVRRNTLNTLISRCVNAQGELQCKAINDVISGLWNDPTQDKNTLLGFKGAFKDVTNQIGDFDDQVLLHFLPGLAGQVAQFRLGENPAYKEDRWKHAVALQKTEKDKIINATEQLALKIQELKDFHVSVHYPAEYQKLNDVITDANLTDDCLFKTMKDKDGYKDFTVRFGNTQAEKKKLCRKLFIALVKSFDIPRSPNNSDGLGVKASVFPEPKPDCSDADWAKYVNSIESLRKEDKKDKTVLSTVGDVMKDYIKSAFDYKGWKAFMDDFSFGSSKKGEILFASETGTMVLDRGIYRANVGGLENFDDGSGRPIGNGPVSRVRKAMLSV